MNLEHIPDKLPELQDEDILTLPRVSVYVKKLKSKYDCLKYSSDASSVMRYVTDIFKSSIVLLSRDILVLSLFNSTAEILVAVN